MASFLSTSPGKKSRSKTLDTRMRDAFSSLCEQIMKDVKADPNGQDYKKVKKIYEEVLYILGENEKSCDFHLVYALYNKYYLQFSPIVKKQTSIKQKSSMRRRNTRGGNRKRRMSKKRGGNGYLDCLKIIYLFLGTGAVITFIMCGGMSRGNMNSVYGQVFKILGMMFASILGSAIVYGISPAFVNLFNIITQRCGYLRGVCERIRSGAYNNVQELRDAIIGAEIQTATEVHQPVDQQAVVEMDIPYVSVDYTNNEDRIIQIDAPINPINVESDEVNRIYGRFLCYMYWHCQRDIELNASPVELHATPVEIQTV